MNPARFIRACTTLWVAGMTFMLPAQLPAGQNMPNMLASDDPSGQLRTYNVKGAIDLDNLFFQPLGTNGRACVSCHEPADGWSVIPAHLRARFDATGGEDPIFRTNDGSTSPFADVSTVSARRTAYNMLLTKGLIRVGIGVPANAEFDLVDVDDPYGYASASELSLFRRPLPSTNLKFLATVMWDGRETFVGQSLHFDLSDQANTATLGHAAAINPLTDDEQQEIVNFELGLFTAQSMDRDAGLLNTLGATGGAVALSTDPFFVGINDVLSPGFNPRVFTLFDAWRNLHSSDRDSEHQSPRGGRTRPGDLQYAADHHQRCQRRERCAGGDAVQRDVHDVPRHAERRGSLDVVAARPRPRGRIAPNARHAALHVPQQDDGRNPEDDRSRPRAHHRQMEAALALQGADPARAGGARALLPQRLGGRALRRRRLLRHAIQSCVQRTGEGGSDRVPSLTVRRAP